MGGQEQTSRIKTIRTAAAPSTGASSDVVARKRRFRRGLWAELWRWAIVVTVTAIVAGGLLLGSLIAAIYWQARTDQSRPVDAIVVLGAAQYNGRPSPVLQARLDEVLEAYEQGLAPVIVVTGGRMAGDQFTEAESSKQYLVDHGIPESAILMENAGRSSWQSMQGAAVVLNEAGLERVLIVSDGFHLFRLKVMARELGLTPFGRADSGSPIASNSSSEFEYVLREAGATIQFLVDVKL